MTRGLVAVICLGVLAGCGGAGRISPFARAVPEQPLPFAARLETRRGSPEFSVAVDTRGAPIAQWRESARFQATQFCLRRFGSSDVVWQEAGGDWARSRAGNERIVVRGRCAAR